VRERTGAGKNLKAFSTESFPGNQSVEKAAIGDVFRMKKRARHNAAATLCYQLRNFLFDEYSRQIPYGIYGLRRIL